jgi:hypothetical protein
MGVGHGKVGNFVFLLKWVKIWNKMPYHFGTLKYPEIKKMFLRE